MGGRDYPPDFGTPDPDDVGGRRDAERAAYRAGGRDALRNLFCPRCSTQASGVLVVFKEGSEWWCGRCVNSWSTDPVKAEAWLAERRAEQREWEAEALKEEQHRQLAEDQQPDLGDPERQHGVGGTAEVEDLPDWARAEIDRLREERDAAIRDNNKGFSDAWDDGRTAGLTEAKSAAAERLRGALDETAERVPPDLEEQRQAVERALNKTWAEIDDKMEKFEELPDWVQRAYTRLRGDRDAWMRRARMAERAAAEQAWGRRDWAAEAMAEHQGRTAGPLDEAQPEVCEENRCDPCRLPGGWWCRGCDKPLRLVRPLYRPDREGDGE